MSNSPPIRLPNARIIGLTVFGLLFVAELSAILILNHGVFLYTLDDPYIHLALAENITKGHYGFNMGEYSAPSSSILWPFLMAPLAGTVVGEYLPLVINGVVSLGTVLVLEKALRLCLSELAPVMREKYIALLLVLLIPGTNLLGLTFMGMEHALQVLCAVLIVYGMMREVESGDAPLWWVTVIVLAPTIRYENAAIAAPAILFLFLRKHTEKALAATLFGVLPVVGFSFFLTSLWLDPVPASISLKTSLTENRPLLKMLADNVKAALTVGRGTLISLFIIPFGSVALMGQNSPRRLFGLCLAVAVCLHLMAGQYGWYNRYEIYIWSVCLLGLLYLSKDVLTTLLKNMSFRSFAVVAALTLLTTTQSYVLNLFTIPLAANNIYEQQFQMYRFVTDYYKKPVAVNDIGRVGYRSRHFVLDLYGLSSPDAFRKSRTETAGTWLNPLCAAHDVRFAMIYDSLFPTLPANWRKVGTLRLGKPRITPAQDGVSFYALDDMADAELRRELPDFIQTLPAGASWTWASATPQNPIAEQL